VGKKRLVFWLITAGGVAAAAVFAPREPTPAPKAAGPTATRSAEPAGSSRFAELPGREAIGRPRGEAFVSRSWTAPPPKASPAIPVVIAPAVAPAMPYRVAGQVMHGEVAQVVLAKGDQVLTVHEGDSLEGGYRVESIAADRVVLLYEPLGTRDSLPVLSTLPVDAQQPAPATISAPPTAQPRAAQLRWEGPKQVRSGETFDVRLKVTSAQPVRASPLQLSFDAKLLQPINVRAGGFFADGMFSYRVNPGGSIFIGASGKGAVASDAEFLVVTFKTIGDAATAELKLSSLILQGAAGSAIVHDHPGAFRTAIVR
jgi:hypothetical protein